MYSKEDKILIFNDRKRGMSYRDLSEKYGIPRSSIQYIVYNYHNVSRKPGPKEKLSKNDIRRIKTNITQKYEKNFKCSIPDIIEDLHLNVSKPTVCRILKSINFKYKKLPHKFQLTWRMRRKRVEAARAFLKQGISWNQVVFSDEKFFTIHGSDCYYAWLDKNMSPRRVKQVVRSPGIMIWGMIMPNGLLSYQVMKGRQKSQDYINIMKSKAIPIMKLNCRKEITFQQDNCPIHVSKTCQEFFKQSGIHVLDWPPYSPDLNIIENIWGFISKDVYGKGPIKNLKNLEAKINNAVTSFNETQSALVANLYNSITTRLCLILEKQGQKLKY